MAAAPAAEEAAPPFDYCVITASSPGQADLYRALVQRRRDCGMYPLGLQFRFYADPPKGRVGSGGGTLVALRNLLRDEAGVSSGAGDEDTVRSFFGSRRILVLHAGGESRRLPCYVPEGKLFGPLSVDVGSKAGCPPVVLDLLLTLYFKYPWVSGEVVLASGDVIVDFDVEGLAGSAGRPFQRGAICGFGKPASLEQGSRHGVFAFAPGGAGGGGAEETTLPVRDFHQKSPVATLREECLVPGTTDRCALDVGIFTMSVDWCCAFFRFAGAPIGEGDGEMTVMAAVDESKLHFDFYLEVVTASLPDQPLASFLRRLEAASELPSAVLEAMHGCLSGLELRGALVANSTFLHFGTLREFPEASADSGRSALAPFYVSSGGSGPGRQVDPGPYSTPHSGGITLLNCAPGSVRVVRECTADRETEDRTLEHAWVEMCADVGVKLSPAGFHLLVGLQGLHLAQPLPAGICLDGRRGGVVAVYSVGDTFKRAKSPGAVTFCGQSLPAWLEARGLTAGDIWDEPEEATSATDLWEARLFRQCGKPEDVEGYWDASNFSRDDFLSAPRFSLRALNHSDSALQRDELRARYFLEAAR